MMTNRNDATAEKKDLHVGGVGSSPRAGLATMVEPWESDAVDIAQRWSQKARSAALSADGVIRDNPWAALGVVAVLGLAAGYFLSRRS
jgi:ElaB/YqjD/DUF883 family membrane-anchored ribosome-binding protein